MTIQTDITAEDWRALVRFVQIKVRQGASAKIKRWLLAFGVGAGFGLVLGLVGGFSRGAIHPESLFLGMVVMILARVVLSRIQMRNMMPAQDGFILGRQSINFAEDGIRICTRLHEALFRWEAVREAQRTTNHIFILIDTTAAIIVPLRSFSAGAERAQFENELQKHSGKAVK